MLTTSSHRPLVPAGARVYLDFHEDTLLKYPGPNDCRGCTIVSVDLALGRLVVALSQQLADERMVVKVFAQPTVQERMINLGCEPRGVSHRALWFEFTESTTALCRLLSTWNPSSHVLRQSSLGLPQLLLAPV